jgi:biopolymer transport protein ExbD
MPGLNTASMPDLIFTVLFFFMIATHARDLTPQVKLVVPQGQLAERTPHRSAVVQVLIGQVNGRWQVQVEGDVVAIERVGEAVVEAKATLADEDQERMTVAIRADRNAPYGLLAKVKRLLREAGCYDVCYVANRKETPAERP